MSRGRILGLSAALLGAAYAVMGGEYSTLDWWRLERAERREEGEIMRLEVEVDSLARELKLLETDSATQERVARERFGMIRDGELLYKLVPDK